MRLRAGLSLYLIVPLIALLVLLTACGGAGRGLPPTQTPMYVVITDTPMGTPAEVAPTPGATATVPPPEMVEIDVPFMCKAQVVEQTFENGYMFWVGGTTEERCRTGHTYAPGTGEIWVIIQDVDRRIGEWLVFVDTWDEATEPESDPALEPSDPTLRQPIRGFGKVWRELLTEEQRAALGWATAGEFQYVADYRYDPGGFLNESGQYVPRPGMHTLVALGGERLIFDEPSRLVFIIGGY